MTLREVVTTGLLLVVSVVPVGEHPDTPTPPPITKMCPIVAPYTATASALLTINK